MYRGIVSQTLSKAALRNTSSAMWSSWKTNYIVLLQYRLDKPVKEEPTQETEDHPTGCRNRRRHKF